MSHELKYFSDEELTVVAEVARIALADGIVFDTIVDEMDLADEELLKIRDKIECITSGVDIEY
jgi:hypothetical protein